jgi:hypothetical protein
VSRPAGESGDRSGQGGGSERVPERRLPRRWIGEQQILVDSAVEDVRVLRDERYPAGDVLRHYGHRIDVSEPDLDSGSGRSGDGA